MKQNQTCVLVPTYNSDTSLEELYSGLKQALDKIDGKWQLVIVDDMSPLSATWATVCKLNNSNDNISAIRLMRNRGRSTAVICGLNFINDKFPNANVVIMDDDLQHNPDDVPKLLEKIKERPDTDVVIGQFPARQTSLINKAGSWMKSWIDHSYYGLPRSLRFGPFIAVNNRLVKILCEIKAQNPMLGSQILQLANHYEGVKCEHNKRRYGKPGFDFRKRLRLFLSIAFSDVTFLSRAFLLLGTLLCIGAFCLSFGLILLYFIIGSKVSGWLSLAIVILFFSGINIFGLSIVFRNIALIKNTTDHMPAWSEREILLAGKKNK